MAGIPQPLDSLVGVPCCRKYLVAGPTAAEDYNNDWGFQWLFRCGRRGRVGGENIRHDLLVNTRADFAHTQHWCILLCVRISCQGTLLRLYGCRTVPENSPPSDTTDIPYVDRKTHRIPDRQLVRTLPQNATARIKRAPSLRLP